MADKGDKARAAIQGSTTLADPLLEALSEALRPFADCVDQIADDEDDEEWAKFRLLIKDYRRAARALAALSSPTDPRDAEIEGLRKHYNELLFAVSKKYEGEDRHETALRYIREREADCDDRPCANKE
jgi:hypothetical protein